MDALYDHAHFDDLDLDARSKWVSKGKQSALRALAKKQAISLLQP